MKLSHFHWKIFPYLACNLSFFFPYFKFPGKTQRCWTCVSARRGWHREKGKGAPVPVPFPHWQHALARAPDASVWLRRRFLSFHRQSYSRGFLPQTDESGFGRSFSKQTLLPEELGKLSLREEGSEEQQGLAQASAEARAGTFAEALLSSRVWEQAAAPLLSVYS